VDVVEEAEQLEVEEPPTEQEQGQEHKPRLELGELRLQVVQEQHQHKDQETEQQPEREHRQQLEQETQQKQKQHLREKLEQQQLKEQETKQQLDREHKMQLDREHNRESNSSREVNHLDSQHHVGHLIDNFKKYRLLINLLVLLEMAVSMLETSTTTT